MFAQRHQSDFMFKPKMAMECWTNVVCNWWKTATELRILPLIGTTLFLMYLKSGFIQSLARPWLFTRNDCIDITHVCDCLTFCKNKSFWMIFLHRWRTSLSWLKKEVCLRFLDLISTSTLTMHSNWRDLISSKGQSKLWVSTMIRNRIVHPQAQRFMKTLIEK